MWRLEVRCKCTSGGPVLSDCIAHPSIWSSRSVNWGETVVPPPTEVGAVSDMVLVFVGECVCSRAIRSVGDVEKMHGDGREKE
jgi:hypothetical protein